MTSQRKMPDLPLALVRWEDAFNGDHDWQPLAEVPAEIEAFHVLTVGHIVRQDADRITLAMSINESGQCCDLFTIPTGCVRNVTILLPK